MEISELREKIQKEIPQGYDVGEVRRMVKTRGQEIFDKALSAVVRGEHPLRTVVEGPWQTSEGSSLRKYQAAQPGSVEKFYYHAPLSEISDGSHITVRGGHTQEIVQEMMDAIQKAELVDADWLMTGVPEDVQVFFHVDIRTDEVILMIRWRPLWDWYLRVEDKLKIEVRELREKAKLEIVELFEKDLEIEEFHAVLDRLQGVLEDDKLTSLLESYDYTPPEARIDWLGVVGHHLKDTYLEKAEVA